MRTGRDAYTFICDNSFAMTRASLGEGEDKYPNPDLRSLIGRHRVDHLPHGLVHAMRAFLELHSAEELIALLLMVLSSPDGGSEEDHLAHAVARLTMESLRQETAWGVCHNRYGHVTIAMDMSQSLWIRHSRYGYVAKCLKRIIDVFINLFAALICKSRPK